MGDSRKQLERAFKLIKQDKTDEALGILRPVTVQEPENVHAWWLLAYAATEPREVREALIRVLRLDPDYTNAPKAREMLEKLNQEYPPDIDELAQFPELQPSFDDVFSQEPSFAEESPFGTSFFPEGELESFGTLEEDMFTPEEPAEPAALTLEESPFFDLESEAPAAEVPKPAKPSKPPKAPKPVSRLIEEPEMLDEETLARIEERTVHRRGRGRRLFRTFVILLVLGLVVAALVVLYNRGGGVTDPGPLQVVGKESPQITAAVSSAQAELNASSFSSGSQIVLANSSLGDTLFVKICGRADPTLPQTITQGMTIAVHQVAAIHAELNAIGVSVETCEAGQNDTLYRAAVSIADAIRYLNGDATWEQFQAAWVTAG